MKQKILPWSNTNRVFDEGHVESTRKDEIGRIRRDENSRGDVSNSKLSMYPSPRVDDIAGNSSHVGEEGRAGKDNWIVSDKASKGEEECVKVEEEQVSDLARLLKHFERQPPN